MTITVTDPDTALDGLRGQVDRLLGMDPAEWTLGQLEQAALDVPATRVWIPRLGGSGCLSTDLPAGDNLSHPRTSVRCEGRQS
jgi:hypothetical protein